MILLILILLVLIYIAYALSKLTPAKIDLSSAGKIEEALGEIKGILREIESDIGHELGAIGGNVKSIENAIRAKVSGWLDEHEIFIEHSENPPAKVQFKTKAKS